jgi:hypothetical protein
MQCARMHWRSAEPIDRSGAIYTFAGSVEYRSIDDIGTQRLGDESER